MPWEYVHAWQVIAGRDGYAWTVLPRCSPHEVTLWRLGRAAQTVALHPGDMVDVLVPSPADAVLSLIKEFPESQVIYYDRQE